VTVSIVVSTTLSSPVTILSDMARASAPPVSTTPPGPTLFPPVDTTADAPPVTRAEFVIMTSAYACVAQSMSAASATPRIEARALTPQRKVRMT
jgi:hypothetical protein